MRLLNTTSLKLEHFVGSKIPEYAILSHRWEAEEVLFEDVQTDQWPQKKGIDKVEKACLRAKDDGFKYIWIDTCCIDKSSSAELSEAINSMFNWYHHSQVCYAYLCDVPTGDTEAFVKSEWFTRGWTLQELIAPNKVQFFDSEWRKIGDRLSLLDSIVKVTAIDRRVLDRGQHHRLCPRHVLRSPGFLSCDCDQGSNFRVFRRILSSFSVARRMSWASTRVTTRVEDQAYSLLGLFNVNMPLLYGEGTKAFRRLQEEIIRSSNDQSILAGQHQERWRSLNMVFGITGRGELDAMVDELGHLFPSHPSAFRRAANLERPSTSSEYLSMTLTNRCLNVDLHMCPCMWRAGTEFHAKKGWLGILDCVYSGDYLSRPAITLDRLSSTEHDRHVLTRAQTGKTLIRLLPNELSRIDREVMIYDGGMMVRFNPSLIEKKNIDLLLHPPTQTHGIRTPAIRINPTVGGHDDMTYRIRTWFPDLEETPNGSVRNVPFILDNLHAIDSLLPGLLAIDDGSSHGFFVAYGFSINNYIDTLGCLAPPKFEPWCRLLAWHQVVPDREFIPQDGESVIVLQEDMARFNYATDNGLPKVDGKTQPWDSMDWPGRPGLRAQVTMTPNTFLGQTVYELDISVSLENSTDNQKRKVQVMEDEVPPRRSSRRRLDRV